MIKVTCVIAQMVMKATLIFEMDAKVTINFECQCIYALTPIILHLVCSGPFILLIKALIFRFAICLQTLMNAITTHALQMVFVAISLENTSVLVDLGKNISKKAIHATLTLS